MNLIFYLSTLGYYSMLIVGIIVTAPGFVGEEKHNPFDWIPSCRMLLGIAVFGFSWWNQFQSNRILVNLRKDVSGRFP